ncbi:ribosome biogenesis factor YjgA [Hahella ganghwensis]|uniref:ribosome biogenesis factor YjgA n=1 Tax=Hahella ganghwensis TaxID=286420 RepID=UPI00037A9A6F|nr:ribosome biogenesis factor YjgA [Hahella ganghwensis]
MHVDNSDGDDHYSDEDFDFGPSKSSKKRAMQALQDLGRELTKLKPDQLDELPISDRLKDALIDYQKFPSHEAKRRQLQYIGKLMREVDEEELQPYLEKYTEGSDSQTAVHHQAERWREQLITGGNEALTAFVDEHPGGDIQHLRHLIRNAQKDLEQNKNRGAAKKLYRYIRDMLEEQV